MNKKTIAWLVAATILVLIGCIIFGGVMSVLKWNFMNLSTVKYETNSYEFNEKIEDISIKTDTADVVFVKSGDTMIHVACYEAKNQKHTVTLSDGTLAIEVEDTRKWYEYIGINFGVPKITVSLPEGEYGELFVKGSTGDISMSEVSANDIKLKVSTGDITVNTLVCEGELEIKVSTGRTKLDGVRSEKFTSKGSTGDISMKDVIARESIFVERDTGDITLDGCDSAELYLKTDTGHVKGSLLTDKIFIAKTDTGRINVPNSTVGGRCEISTDTGNINIEIK